MGISLRDAFFIEIDTYFELLDLYNKQNANGITTHYASQEDIDRFLF